ncbi:N-acetylmuramoyl-L-alanine amidase [Saccharopolyspora taberi]|uniref:N-acetylmuramoyl-L-alanine amidase n=1 Tax=Saccharopolyspora taberi TaxID=60895 RepID=A0ABN3VCW9_9PSEU
MSLHRSPVARRSFLVGGLTVTAVGALGLPASARPAAPEIAGTADWGAREPSSAIDVLDSKPTKIIVHHTASANVDDTSQAQAFALSRSIQDHHMDGNGWKDTGQNFTNSRGGWITEGRHKSLSVLQEGAQHVLGAHAGDQNSVALGIENEGTYTDVDVPEKLWTSLVSLCSYMVSQYGISASEIYGHRDFMSTECPGEVFYGRLPELREAVGAAVGQRVVHPVTWLLLKPGAGGPAVTATQHLLRAQGLSVPVDGAYGPQTQAATGEFLRSHRIEAATCHATRVEEPGYFGGTAWTALAPVLAGDSRGDAVLALQVLLTSRGHYVPADAQYAGRSADAVREFQSAQGLQPTGVADHEVWKRLLR